MKRLAALALVVVLAVAALYLAQRRHRSDVVSPNAILAAAADWQRDAARAPMHLTRLSDQEEIRIGDQLASNTVAAQPPLDPEAAATQLYIERVGARLAAHAHRRLPFRFHLIASRDLINAFALPGGHVFIGQGLLDRMTSEDELAFILAHEVEHIDHHHAVERVQVEAQLQHLDLDILASLASLPLSLWQAGYSKDEELEADREGLRLAAASGYAPQGALNAFEHLARLQREYIIHAQAPADELSQVAIEGLRGYFRSHPEPSERLAQARDIIARDPLDLSRPLTPFRLEYEVTSGSR